jgi:hypothetical protein
VLYGSRPRTAGSSATWRRIKHEGMEALFDTIVSTCRRPQVDDRTRRSACRSARWPGTTTSAASAAAACVQGRHKQGRCAFVARDGALKDSNTPTAGWDVTVQSNERPCTRLGDARPRQAGSRRDRRGRHRLDGRSQGDQHRRHVQPRPSSSESRSSPLEIEEPTVSMFFLVNSGPFAGQDGKAGDAAPAQGPPEKRAAHERGAAVEDIGRGDGVKVSGRGELHLAILIEEMRREGMELCVSRPEVITAQGTGGRDARADGDARDRRARAITRAS